MPMSDNVISMLERLREREMLPEQREKRRREFVESRDRVIEIYSKRKETELQRIRELGEKIKGLIVPKEETKWVVYDREETAPPKKDTFWDKVDTYLEESDTRKSKNWLRVFNERNAKRPRRVEIA